MDRKSELFLHVQYYVGRIAVFFIEPLYFFIARLLFYRVHNLKEIRRQCAEELSRHKGPWIVCSNHLTMIDSFLLTYAIFSFGAYLKDYKKIPWNLPERSNFQKNIVLAVLCYLSKCIPVDRGGPREKTKKMLEKCMYLMRSGQNIMIFPEGGRSRTGRVDKEGFSYGVGRFVQDVENCKIMCVYMRGDKQATSGFIPAWGEKFYAQVEVFTPERAVAGGLRAQREYAAQIVDKLVQMEEKYFVLHRQRCCGLGTSGKLEQKQRFPVSEENPHQC
ncbi:MAG: lysophospholipid acyltransferase family protein [Smithella sp.]